MVQHSSIDHTGITGVLSSYASNANSVAAVAAGGAATTASRGDHVHVGVTSISHSSNTISGPITLVAEGSIGITKTNATTYSINAVAGAAAGGGSGAPTDASYVTFEAEGGLSNERVVTAPATGGNIPYVVRKASNETVNGSNVLQDDDALVVALAANEVWHFECFLFFSSATTPDIKFAWTVPAAATLTWWAPETFNATGVSYGNSTITTSGGSRAFEGAGAGTVRGMYMIGVVANGANAGNLQLQWAQETSNGTDTIVYANSLLRAWLLA